MSRNIAIVARGRLSDPRHIELAAPVREIRGEVEVLIRQLPSAPTEDIFDVIASLAPGSRSKANIDEQIQEERASLNLSTGSCSGSRVAGVRALSCCLPTRFFLRALGVRGIEAANHRRTGRYDVATEVTEPGAAQCPTPSESRPAIGDVGRQHRSRD
jgi:hypothetical protein